MLPFIYVCSHLFKSETAAMMSLITYQFLIQYILPYLLMPLRVNSNSEVLGDNVFKLMKILPLESVTSSIVFNSQLLANMSRYRDQNSLGKGDDIETDEGHSSNGEADIFWIIIHCIVFWVILIVFIEW